MRILQLHVDHIEFEPISPEGSVFERIEGHQKTLVKDALVLFTCIEEGDTEELAEEVLREVTESAKRLNVSKVVIYPYAHLSRNLADPKKAYEVFKVLVDGARRSGLEAWSAPFGWTKRFTISIKGHPLAEQFKEWEGRASGVTRRVIPRRPERREPISKSERAETVEPRHIKLGRELEIFQINEFSGPGLPLFPPRGFIIRDSLMSYIREINKELGFQEVWTPHLLKSDLWHMTGHYETYRERMFVVNVDDDEYVLKPMNCPAHALIYASRPRSYKDLPIAYAEFGTVYRNEQSGELTGLLRVRALTQDDGHVFLRPDQIEDVVKRILRAILRVMDSILKAELQINLSTRPEKYIGDLETWDLATESLRSALDDLDIEYSVKEGEGAFYGPKIDVEVVDALGRYWQCSTIQLDFFMPERLGLEYVDADGTSKRPVMIHRAILGSIERFTALLLEHYEGRLPFWLSPEQVRILPLSEEHEEYAKEVARELSEFRISIDVEGSLSKRIRKAHNDRVPFTVVVGERERSKKVISVRDAKGNLHEDLQLDAFRSFLRRLVVERLANVGTFEP